MDPWFNSQQDFDRTQRFTQHKKRMEDHFSKKKTQYYPDLDDLNMHKQDEPETPLRATPKMSMEGTTTSSAGKDQINKAQQLKE